MRGIFTSGWKIITIDNSIRPIALFTLSLTTRSKQICRVYCCFLEMKVTTTDISNDFIWYRFIKIPLTIRSMLQTTKKVAVSCLCLLGGIVGRKDTCWQIVWSSVWVTTLISKSVLPLIMRGRRPNRAPHTTSFIPTDRFAQQTFCFRALWLVFGGGHTTQTLTRATFEPLSHTSTSTSHTGWASTTHALFWPLNAHVFGQRGHRCGSTPGMKPPRGPVQRSSPPHTWCSQSNSTNCFMFVVCLELTARPPSH